jgi:hypothetical protein
MRNPRVVEQFVVSSPVCRPGRNDRSRLIDWEIASHRAPVASDLESLSPYVERPSIPEGVTLDEYRRARLPQTKPLLNHLLGWLRHLHPAPASPREKQRLCRRQSPSTGTA